jgi:hypothetical protein
LFCFVFGGTWVWIQGLTLARQALLPFGPLCQPHFEIWNQKGLNQWNRNSLSQDLCNDISYFKPTHTSTIKPKRWTLLNELPNHQLWSLWWVIGPKDFHQGMLSMGMRNKGIKKTRWLCLLSCSLFGLIPIHPSNRSFHLFSLSNHTSSELGLLPCSHNLQIFNNFWKCEKKKETRWPHQMNLKSNKM